MLNILRKITLIFFAFCLSGCMLARVLVSEELLLVRGTAFRATAARIAITEEAIAMRSIARLRIKPGTLAKPVLYLPEAGVNKPIFEILTQSSVRRISTGEVFNLPFRIFRVNGLAKAELREGPGTTYKLYKTLNKDRLVLVRDEIPGWYKIQVDDLLGWVIAASLFPAVDEKVSSSSSGNQIGKPKITYSTIPCYNCNGLGNKTCEDCNQSGIEDCPSCKGKGNHKCTNCDGIGRNTCLVCKGRSKDGCPSCKGIGFLDCRICKSIGYFNCSMCHSIGKISCAVCDGKLHTKCYYCFGTSTIQKRNEK